MDPLTPGRGNPLATAPTRPLARMYALYHLSPRPTSPDDYDSNSLFADLRDLSKRRNIAIAECGFPERYCYVSATATLIADASVEQWTVVLTKITHIAPDARDPTESFGLVGRLSQCEGRFWFTASITQGKSGNAIGVLVFDRETPHEVRRLVH